jgi:hypothetical protein
MMHTATTEGVVRESEASRYLEEHWRLRVVADILPVTSSSWQRLDSTATRCRMRVLYAPWYRASQPNRRRVVHAWRFADGSCILRLRDPSHLEVLGPEGLSAVLMHDTHAAIRCLLRHVDIPLFDSLAASYLSHHGRLPPLSPEDVLCALRSRRREFRLAAIASLSAGQQR